MGLKKIIFGTNVARESMNRLVPVVLGILIEARIQNGEYLLSIFIRVGSNGVIVPQKQTPFSNLKMRACDRSCNLRKKRNRKLKVKI